jgi:eukaryotic-like serine/threonine-protein kinase
MAAVDGPLQPGTRLSDYLVLHAIGSGGMGVVYAAQQDRPRRTVALKVLRRGFRHPEILRRFELEAEMLGRLQHPGIAQVFAFKAGDGIRYPARHGSHGARPDHGDPRLHESRTAARPLE